MNVSDITHHLSYECGRRKYVVRFEILNHSASLIKARIFIAPETFIQVYRNDLFNTTNLALIHNGQRIYARDELNGMWHRHPAHNPQIHDRSPEGQRPVTLSKFLDEVENILAETDLP
jgi:hypothetical protein